MPELTSMMNIGKRLICQESDDIIKKISERGFVYETICYVCIALAIAKKIVIANAIPKNISLGGKHGLYKSRRNSAH